MDVFRTIDRINILHRLIDAEQTGNPTELAKKLGISRGTLYNMLDELKSFGAPICYSRTKESFLYTVGFELSINYSLKVIDSDEELKKISGGCAFFASVQFFRLISRKFAMSIGENHYSFF